MRFQEFVGDLITIFWQIRSKAFQIWWCYISWLDQMSHSSRKLHKDHGCDTLDMPAPILSGQHPVHHFLSILRLSSLFHIPHISQFWYTTAACKSTPKSEKIFRQKCPNGPKFLVLYAKNWFEKKVRHCRCWWCLLFMSLHFSDHL